MGRDMFKGWHTEPSFWREVYARTVASVAAAVVIFLAAVAGGYVSLHRSVALFAVNIIVTLTVGGYLGKWATRRPGWGALRLVLALFAMIVATALIVSQVANVIERAIE